MLDVDHLNVWYGMTEVLRDVSFKVPSNEIVALLGGNGSGKPTVLNALSGLVLPRAGSIALGGRGLAGASTDTMVKAGIVQVPQGREVFATMTVQDNLLLGAATRHDRAAILGDIDEMFTLFPRLGERAQRRAGTLSGGEQQMIAVARALMARPRLLLMDEPSVGLAPKIVDEVIETILRLRDQGLTILLVEQNVGVAAAVAGTAYVLKDGEIAYTGDAPELINDAKVLASYLGG